MSRDATSPWGGVLGMPVQEDTWGRPRTHWRDYISRLAWECLGFPTEELLEVTGERNVWISLLRLPDTDKWQKTKRIKMKIQSQFASVLPAKERCQASCSHG